MVNSTGSMLLNNNGLRGAINGLVDELSGHKDVVSCSVPPFSDALAFAHPESIAVTSRYCVSINRGPVG